MTTTPVTRDLVQGLVDYVSDVKPYHTKILEIWVEYIYNDKINGRVKDGLEMEIHMDIDRRIPCNFGWDTTPWDMFWNVKDAEELKLGSFTYTEAGELKSIAKFDAYQLFFKYLTDRWKWRIGERSEPEIESIIGTDYYALTHATTDSDDTPSTILNECIKHWQTMTQDNQFWLDPRYKRLHKRVGSSWVEQPSFTYAMHAPLAPTEGEYWFSTTVSKLYVRLIDGWAEINKVYMSYDVPDAPPVYPEQWKSNWDYPECGAPYGETHIHARVSDLLTFEHGTEIFLFDHARVAVVDPTGRDMTRSEYSNRMQRMEHPVKFKTTLHQTSKYNHKLERTEHRYKIERTEISVVTDPTNPAIADTKWNIDLGGYDFQGWDIERNRKDVKLGAFQTWQYTEQGRKLTYDTMMNVRTFRFRADGVNLIVQRSNPDDSLTDIDVPWVDGTVVYVRSTGDLPSYNLPTQDAYKDMTLDRYRPYRVVRIDGDPRRFSLALADLNTLAFDAELMGDNTHLEFKDGGNGRMYIGIGYPVPFMEIRTHFTDHIKSKKIKDTLSSSMEAFLGQKYLEIVDVILGYDVGTDQNYNGFVIEGNYPAFLAGSEIKVANSYNNTNNGVWTVSHNQVWSNTWAGFTDAGIPIKSTPPDWWNVTRMGAWPTPTKKPQTEIDELVALGQYENEYSEYNYDVFTTLAVSGPAPIVTARSHGYIILDHFSFNDGSGMNRAAATVADKLTFGSYRAIQNPDGTTRFELEVGVPGMSLFFKEKIATTIQEGLDYNDPYGGPTIGSYDITYFDQDTYDENLATIALRMQDQEK